MRHPALHVLALALIVAVLASLAMAQSAPPRPFEIAASEVRTVRSDALGRAYDLYIKPPPGYGAPENTDRRYPVVVINDAGYGWLTAVGLTRAPFNLGGYEPAILVGVSYAKDERGTASRVRDYTPTNDPEWRAFETGGGASYLDFLRDEALPFVDAQYRTDPERRTLVGHSLGGLFAAYALLTAPGLFTDYVLSSPSLWYHEETIFALAAERASTGVALSGQVFIAVGSTETPAISGRPHDMVGQAAAFAERLKAHHPETLAVRHVVYDGATHLTTYPAALAEALRWVLPGPDIYGG
ncbi:MAG: alpha/beta hydrolase [Maricaulaceae bacterium]